MANISIEDLFLPPCMVCLDSRQPVDHQAICPRHRAQYVKALKRYYEGDCESNYRKINPPKSFDEWTRFHYPATSRIAFDIPEGRDLSKKDPNELLESAKELLKKLKSSPLGMQKNVAAEKIVDENG